MNKTERIKISENLKSLINNSIDHLPAGELLTLINLSARAELCFKKNKNINDAGNIETELMEMMKKYNEISG